MKSTLPSQFEQWNLVLTQYDAINVLTDDSGRIQIKSYSLADNICVEFYLLVKDQDDKPLADARIKYFENDGKYVINVTKSGYTSALCYLKPLIHYNFLSNILGYSKISHELTLADIKLNDTEFRPGLYKNENVFIDINSGSNFIDERFNELWSQFIGGIMSRAYNTIVLIKSNTENKFIGFELNPELAIDTDKQDFDQVSSIIRDAVMEYWEVDETAFMNKSDFNVKWYQFDYSYPPQYLQLFVLNP